MKYEKLEIFYVSIKQNRRSNATDNDRSSVDIYSS